MLGGKISEVRARQGIETLGQLTLIQVPITDLLVRMWELRGNVSAYDAAYVAAAEFHDAPLLTADTKLSNATGPRCRIQVL
jgi:predicted nucleic acid-binding protein